MKPSLNPDTQWPNGGSYMLGKFNSFISGPFLLVAVKSGIFIPKSPFRDLPIPSCCMKQLVAWWYMSNTCLGTWGIMLLAAPPPLPGLPRWILKNYKKHQTMLPLHDGAASSTLAMVFILYSNITGPFTTCLEFIWSRTVRFFPLSPHSIPKIHGFDLTCDGVKRHDDFFVPFLLEHWGMSLIQLMVKEWVRSVKNAQRSRPSPLACLNRFSGIHADYGFLYFFKFYTVRCDSPMSHMLLGVVSTCNHSHWKNQFIW